MKILFICKYNRFRSQIAENYFRKINRNKNIKSYSAGIIIGIPIAESVKAIAKKLGFSVNGKPKGIQETLLKEIDLLVIVANNVSPSLFRNITKKVIVWKIPDTTQENYKQIEKISKQIIKKVDVLVKSLRKAK
jgi:protein-tyrosine-phosphatase